MRFQKPDQTSFAWLIATAAVPAPGADSAPSTSGRQPHGLAYRKGIAALVPFCVVKVGFFCALELRTHLRWLSLITSRVEAVRNHHFREANISVG